MRSAFSRAWPASRASTSVAFERGVRALISHRQTVAAGSLAVTLLLTTLKLLAALSTNGLGLLAETANGGLDVVGTLLTLLAVRWADQPPDHDHPYGHEKVEHLAAFIQVTLLIITATWIIGQATTDLFLRAQVLQPTWGAFVVLVVAILLDSARARVFKRAASSHASQAFEANALNFQTDVWSSVVVLAGMGLTVLGERLPAVGVLSRADAIAAIVVALFVVWNSIQLGRETVDALLDRAPEERGDGIRAVITSVPQVRRIKRVRVRRSGSYHFVDVVAGVDRALSVASAHNVSDAIEERIRALHPRTDTLVHLEPEVDSVESVRDQIHFLAGQDGIAVHEVQVFQVHETFQVILHIEVDRELSLEEAHQVASDLEHRIRSSNDRIGQIDTHVEECAPAVERREEVTGAHRGLVTEIDRVTSGILGPRRCHDIRIFRSLDRGGADYAVVMHCTFPSSISVVEAHRQADTIERTLRFHFPQIEAILVHPEPVPLAG